MATSPLNRDNVHHRSNNNPLNNFSFLKWGHKSHANSVHRSRRSIDYDRRREMVFHEDRSEREGLGSEFGEERVDEMDEEVEVEGKGKEKLWNLRPRKTSGVGKNGSQIGMNGGGGASVKGGEGGENNGEGVMNAANKSMRLRGMVEGANGEGVEKKKEKAKLWISLSKEEIEEDIFILTGSRPARRPKKRPRTVQKQLDIVFPGLSLLGATAESFKIPYSPPKK